MAYARTIARSTDHPTDGGPGRTDAPSAPAPPETGPAEGEWAALAEILSRSPLDAAPDLLGHVIEVGRGPERRAGRIVEVEAYHGAEDPASHAYRGPTPRTLVMFGPAGRLYVYLSYGVHWCANVVCGPDGEAGAVLLRAIEPLDGLVGMWRDRPKAKRETDLGSGPGKLCAALGIDHDHNGTDLLARDASVRLRAGTGIEPDLVRTGPRVGISRATEWPWRFVIDGNPHVSRPRPPSFGAAVGRGGGSAGRASG